MRELSGVLWEIAAGSRGVFGGSVVLAVAGFGLGLLSLGGTRGVTVGRVAHVRVFAQMTGAFDAVVGEGLCGRAVCVCSLG